MTIHKMHTQIFILFVEVGADQERAWGTSCIATSGKHWFQVTTGANEEKSVLAEGTILDIYFLPEKLFRCL